MIARFLPKCSICGDTIIDTPFILSDHRNPNKHIHSHNECFQEISRHLDSSDATQYIIENRFDLNRFDLKDQ